MHTASRGRAVAAADLLRAADERARKTICDITEPAAVRKSFEQSGKISRLHHARREDGPRGIYAFLRDLADFASNRVPEQDVRALAGQVNEFLDSLFPVVTESLPQLDVEESMLDGEEHLLVTRRLALGLSPVELEHEAEVDRHCAAMHATHARALSFEASRLRFSTVQGQRA